MECVPTSSSSSLAPSSSIKEPKIPENPRASSFISSVEDAEDAILKPDDGSGCDLDLQAEVVGNEHKRKGNRWGDVGSKTT